MDKPNDPPLRIAGKLNENYAGDPYRNKDQMVLLLKKIIDKNLLAYNTFRIGRNTTFNSIKN